MVVTKIFSIQTTLTYYILLDISMRNIKLKQVGRWKKSEKCGKVLYDYVRLGEKTG